MTAAAGKRNAKSVESYIAGLGDYNLVAGWNVLAQEVPMQPRPRAAAHLWDRETLRGQLFLAGDLVPPEDAERRVLVLANPGLEGRPATTPTIFSDVQLVLPGEVTNIHRHTPSAIRFMLEGEGSYAMGNGRTTDQVFGDLVLGPGWGWHSHGNKGNEPVIWFDALDIPLVKFLDGSFFEGYKSETFEGGLVRDTTSASYGLAGLLPIWERGDEIATPRMKYPWSEARAALAGLPDDKASPFDDLILRYINPLNGGPCLPTLSCELQRLRPGAHTEAHRHTSSVIYVVAEGQGQSTIGDRSFEWNQGDIFVLPSWQAHDHRNLSRSEDAVLFSVNDRPTLEKLGLYREEAL